MWRFTCMLGSVVIALAIAGSGSAFAANHPSSQASAQTKATVAGGDRESSYAGRRLLPRFISCVAMACHPVPGRTERAVGTTAPNAIGRPCGHW